MDLWLDRLIKMDHYLALRKEAEVYRIIHQYQMEMEKPRVAQCRALFRFEAFLSRLGEYLQRRYGNASSVGGIKRREA